MNAEFSARGAGSDSLSDISNLTGSSFGDTLTGDGNDNILTGGDGNDLLTGLFGNDTLFGDYGDDVLYGNQNNDVLHGDVGNDMLIGGLGTNVLTGGSGADAFVMNAQGRNSILNFSQSDGDRIDVRPIGFASANQLVVTQATDASHYLIESDLNGDGTAYLYLNVFGAATAPDQNAFIFA